MNLGKPEKRLLVEQVAEAPETPTPVPQPTSPSASPTPSEISPTSSSGAEQR